MITHAASGVDVPIGDDVLSFQVENGQWCKCYLQTQSERRFLGAEVCDVLISRLERVFDKEAGSTAGAIDGTPVRWILSLSEAHHSLYATTPDKEQVHLFWQDPQAIVVHKMLSTASQWQDLLKQLHSRLPRKG